MIPNKLMPWQMASARKIAVAHMTLGLLWGTAFWTMWAAVMFPEGKAK